MALRSIHAKTDQKMVAELCANFVRIHTWVGHIDNESAQHVDSEKPSQLFLVLLAGFEPLVFGSRVDALPIEPPRHRHLGTCSYAYPNN